MTARWGRRPAYGAAVLGLLAIAASAAGLPPDVTKARSDIYLQSERNSGARVLVCYTPVDPSR